MASGDDGKRGATDGSDSGNVRQCVGAGMGTALGIGAGGSVGTALIGASAAAGTTGAAATTSGLAALGSIVGGGMLTGVTVAALPVAALAAAGCLLGWCLTGKKRENALPSVDQMQIEKSKTNISNWLDKGKTDYPKNRSHFIAFMELLGDGDSVSKNDLERKLGNGFSKLVLSDLCSFSSDPHHTNGKIFEQTGDELSLWEPIADFARAEWKRFYSLCAK